MKAIIIILVALLYVRFDFAQTQDFKLSSVSVSIGKSALSSGYDIGLNFSDGSHNFNVIGNHQRVYGTYSWDVAPFTVMATGGFFKNAPWVGPEVVFAPTSFITIVSWYGFSWGVPDYPSWKMTTMVQYNAISIHAGGVSINYAFSKFVNDKLDHIPGIAYSGTLNHAWSYSISVDYSENMQQPLFMFGMQCKF